MNIARHILLVLLVFSIGPIVIAQNLNRSVYDSIRKKPILIDHISIEGLQQGEFASYYFKEYESYRPNPKVLNQLYDLMADVKIRIVLATWCIDSKRQVPRFIKILDQLNFDLHQLEMIGVDSRKLAGEIDIEDLNIGLVPTFIFYKQNNEIGRIIERPTESLEEDMLIILTDLSR